MSACWSNRRKERGPRGHVGAVAGLGQVGFQQNCCFPDQATLCTPSAAGSNVMPVVVPISGAALQLPGEASTFKLKVVRRHCYTHKPLLMPNKNRLWKNRPRQSPAQFHTSDNTQRAVEADLCSPPQGQWWLCPGATGDSWGRQQQPCLQPGQTDSLRRAEQEHRVPPADGRRSGAKNWPSGASQETYRTDSPTYVHWKEHKFSSYLPEHRIQPTTFCTPQAQNNTGPKVLLKRKKKKKKSL